MNPQNQKQPDIQVNNPLTSMQPGERNIFEVKRHPIGIIAIYASAACLLLVVAVIVFVVAPMMFPHTGPSITTYGSVVLVAMAVIALGYTFVANAVYWGNRWILTTDSITQVTKSSLFDSQHSQLSLGNLEDVTSNKDGVLAHMFNFGVLKVETAGERSKFVFPYCPDPDKYARMILNQREIFEQHLEANEGAGQAYPTGVNTGTAATEQNPGVQDYSVPTGDDT